jgi:hypothetical protein
MSNDDFFEVSSDVPFQPIRNIKIESVKVKDGTLVIRACMTLVRGPEG